MDRRQDIEAELRVLKSSLDASSSDIGDWKIIKIYEARLQGKEDPYDYDELAEQRESVRQRIRELQEEFKNLPEE